MCAVFNAGKFLGLMLLVFAPTFASAWDLSSDISITQASGGLDGRPSPALSIKVEAKEVVVSITDVFYQEGSFDTPWLSAGGGRPSTLHVGTSSGFSFFSTKSEYVRSLKLKIARYRLEPNTVLYVYNDDTEEVLGHVVVP
jgi:hypothetical protein